MSQQRDDVTTIPQNTTNLPGGEEEDPAGGSTRKRGRDEDEEEEGPPPIWTLPLPTTLYASCTSYFEKNHARVMKRLCEFSEDSHGLPSEVWLLDQQGREVCKVSWPVMQAMSPMLQGMSDHKKFVEISEHRGILIKGGRDTVLAFRDFLHVGYPRKAYPRASVVDLLNMIEYYQIEGLFEWFRQRCTDDPHRAFSAIACSGDIESHDFTEQILSQSSHVLFTPYLANQWSKDPAFQADVMRIPFETMDSFLDRIKTGRYDGTGYYATGRNKLIFRLIMHWYAGRARACDDHAAVHQQACMLCNFVNMKVLGQKFLARRVAPSTLIPTKIPTPFEVDVRVLKEPAVVLGGLRAFDTGATLRLRACQAIDYDIPSVRLIYNGEVILDSDMLIQFDMWEGRQAGIALYVDLLGADLLGTEEPCNEATRDSEVLSSLESVEETPRTYVQGIITRFEGIIPKRPRYPHFATNPAAGVLNAAACDALVNLIRLQRASFRPQRSANASEYVGELSPMDLRVEVGDTAYGDLGWSFEYYGYMYRDVKFNRIFVRYVEAPFPVVGFHTGDAAKSMVVMLNDPAEYTGGMRVFTTDYGFMFHRTMNRGEFCVYEWDIPQATTALTGGAMYTLHLLYVDENTPSHPLMLR